MCALLSKTNPSASLHELPAAVAMFDRDWIAAHIPHQGSMCLLDSVESWDETGIVCQTGSHLLPDHPLRTAGSLGILNGIEYAAQAMAVHGAMLAGDTDKPKAGFLMSVRDIRWYCTRLDQESSRLMVRATRISGNQAGILYHFSLDAEDRILLTGRASVMLDADSAGVMLDADSAGVMLDADSVSALPGAAGNA